MKAFVVVPKPAPRIQRIFAEAGKNLKGKQGFVESMDKLPEDIMKKLKEHAIYLSNLKNLGKLLFAGVTDDFKDAIIVYAAGSLEEARSLTEGDPFIKSGLFASYEIKSLYHWM
jgi:uncharacterized protein YciI